MPKGKHIRTPEMIEKFRQSRTGKWHSKETKEKLRQKLLWRKFSPETIEKMRQAARDKRADPEYYQMKCDTACKWEAHPYRDWWTTPLHKQIRRCFKYRQWRSDVYTRDDYTCCNCWRRWWHLEADHIKYFITIIKENHITSLDEANECEELWNINNWQTLCYDCHRVKTKIDAGILKLNKD